MPYLRLEAAAGLVKSGDVLCDVGSDHAYLPLMLIKNGVIERAVACDVNAGPLERGRQHAAKQGVSSIEFVLSDGLGSVETPFDVAAICGMGGELIARILEANLPAAKNARCITMQPMRGIEELRQFLRKNEFRIIDERLVLDAGRIYQIIGAKSGEPAPLPSWFPQTEYSFGPMLFEKRDPLLIPLLESYRDGHLRRLEKARRKGVTPKALTEIIDRMNGYINIAQEMHKNEAE